MLTVGKRCKFDFVESCLSAFEDIKSRLVIAPILTTPDWNKEKSLKSCVMPVTMQWEQFWDKEQRKFSRPYTMPANPSMRHKRTTLPHRRRCWQWFLPVKNLDPIYWVPMSSYTLFMQ